MLFDAVDERGLEMFITTNGTRIREEEWAALDGIGPIHDAISGQGTYEKTTESIRRARRRQRV